MNSKAFCRFALDPLIIVDVVQMLRHGEIDRALAYAEAKIQIIEPLECVDDGDGEADSSDRDLPDDLIKSPGMNIPKP